MRQLGAAGALREGRLVQAHAGRRRQIQRLRAAVDRQAQREIGERERRPRRARAPRCRTATPWARPAATAAREEVPAPDVGRDDAHARRVRALDGVREVHADRDRQVEQRAGRGADDLRVVRVDGAAGEDDGIRARGIRGPDDRAEVARDRAPPRRSRRVGATPANTSRTEVGVWRATATMPCGVTVSAIASRTRLGGEDDLDSGIARGVAQVGVPFQCGRRREDLDDASRDGTRAPRARPADPRAGTARSPGARCAWSASRRRERGASAGSRAQVQYGRSSDRTRPRRDRRHAKGRPPEGGRPCSKRMRVCTTRSWAR